MYIDDLLIIGKPETNENTIHDLKQCFDIKKPTTLDDYLSVQVVKSEDMKRAWLGHATIIDANKEIWKGSGETTNNINTRNTRFCRSKTK